MAQTPLVQDRTPLNEVKYAGRDFASIFDALMRRIKVEYTDVYNDFAETDQGIMLVDLCAYAAGLICWALDRVASDCFLSTVRTPMPAGWLARQLGYKMIAAAASSADLDLVFPAGIPAPCTLTAGWRFMGPESIPYELVADRVLGAQAPGYTTMVSVRQGQTRTLSYVGDGTQFQKYNLEYAGEGEYLAETSVRVWVDGAEWTEQDFLSYEATNQFEVDYQAVPPHVRFGDGKAGAVPATGADIKIQFLKIVGAAGNVKADTITTSLDVLTAGGVAVAFTLTNALPARSGRDAETVDHARRVAPFAFAARGGAITRTDYQAQANGYVDPLYGAVDKAYAVTPRDPYDDIVFNNYEDQIRAFITAFEAAVDAAVIAFNADLVAINGGVSDIDAARVIMEGLRTALLGNVAAILASLASAKATLLSNEGNYSTVGSAYADFGAQYAAMLAWAAVTLTPAEVVALTAFTTPMNEAVQTMKAAADAMHTGDLTARGAIDNAETQANAAQPVVADTTGTLAVQLAAQAAEVVALGAPLADVTAHGAAMDAAATALEVGVDPILIAMQARVGELFDNSCRSNLVQVPILSVDADGEYIAPPSGLIASLQAYLETKKEVTQLVEVIDGSIGLVPVDITVSVKVGTAYVAAEVVSAIDATVRGIMRGREYAAPLYLSDVYRYVRACSAGIEYAFVTLDGGSANIVPAASQILVLGTLSIGVI